MSARCLGIDLLRGIAAFGIVGCHLSLEPKTIGGDIVTSLCDFNVGLFAAVAGFLMCGNDCESWLAYVRKRFWRLLPVYFSWSIVYLCLIAVFDVLFDGGHINPRYHTVGFWLSVVFWGGCASQLWFLPSLFYAQILTSVFFCFGGKQRNGLVWFLLGGVLIICSAGLDGWWYGRYPLRLLAFLVTGYGIGVFVKPHIDVLKQYSLIIVGVAIAVLGLHVWLRDSIHGFYRDWIAVGPVLLSFVALDFKSCQVKQVALTLGATSMGVYLVHPLFARILSLVAGKLISPPYSASVIFADWVIVWGFTMLTVLLMRQMPFAKKFL